MGLIRMSVAGFAVAIALGGSLVATVTSAQQYGGNLTGVLRSDPEGLMLAIFRGGDTQVVAGKIYEGLLNYTTELKPIPSLAKSWEISPDGLTYTFRLQDGVSWHDGTPFTSDDVLFSLSEMLPETSSNARDALQAVASITAPDAGTVIITLKKPVPYFIMQFPRQLLPIVPAHIYRGTKYLDNPANATPIGTGPFKFVEWRRGSFIRLAKNEDYWQKDLPYLDGITIRIIPDGSARAIALESGDIDVATSREIGMSDIKRFRDNKDIVLETKGFEYYSSLAMLELNNREPLLNDVRFRKALTLATDRAFIQKNVWQKTGIIATGPISSTIPFYSADVPVLGYDVEKANALLDDMGLTRSASGMRNDASGNPIKLDLVVLPGAPWDRLSEYIREAWKAIGIEVELNLVDLGNWYKRIGNWDYDVAITNVGMFGDPGIGSRNYYHSDNMSKSNWGTNTSGYSNPEVDRWYDEAAIEMDPTKRGELYAKIQKQMVEDAAEIWLLEMEVVTLHSAKVHNIVGDGFGPRGPWATVYIDK